MLIPPYQNIKLMVSIALKTSGSIEMDVAAEGIALVSDRVDSDSAIS